MNLRLLISASLLVISSMAFCQIETLLNQTDSRGRKQGHWIKKNQDETVLYEGYFKDDHPVGEFKRFYENKVLKSVLQYNSNGTEALATLYHPNGNIASRGKYVNQKKEGKWQFFSSVYKDYLISEDMYAGNLRNGLSVKFYPDSTIAEKVSYVNDIKHGEWISFYPTGSVCLKSNYSNGRIEGKFEAWFENGKIQFSGQYKNDARDGQWLIYDNEGKLKYKIEYKDGITNDRQMDIDESGYLDSLDNDKGKAADPEKSGAVW